VIRLALLEDARLAPPLGHEQLGRLDICIWWQRYRVRSTSHCTRRRRSVRQHHVVLRHVAHRSERRRQRRRDSFTSSFANRQP